MASISQRNLVAQTVLTGRVNPQVPNTMHRRTYVVPHQQGMATPAHGDVITSIPGAYWMIVAAAADDNRWVLVVEPLRPTSYEAHHMLVYHLPGGTLI